MEVNVKIIEILAPQTFTSSRDGSSIVKNVFVGETAGQYPKKIAFSVIGEDKFKLMNIVVGNTYNVSFDVESRQWKDKWFTECSAWKTVSMDGTVTTVIKASDAVQAVATDNPNPSSVTEKKDDDDLPF